MKVALITGAYGFLGRNTALEFNKQGYKVFGIGHGSWTKIEYRKFGIDQFIESDVDFESITSLNKEIDIIVHCAGSGSVNKSYQEPLNDFKKTVDSLISTLEYIRKSNSKIKLIYPSSAAVYGNRESVNNNEEDELDPISPYGMNKKIAEELCDFYSNNFGLNISIIRFFSIYGVGLKKQLLWDACNKILNSDNQKIEFWGTGNETRDWLNVKDAASLIYTTTQQAKKFDIINGGTGKATTNKNLLNIVAQEMGSNSQIIFNKITKEGDPKHYCANIKKASNLGWKEETSVQKGIEEYVNWYKSQKI